MTTTVKNVVDTLVEARQKYRANLIPLGEYMGLIDKFLDPEPKPEPKEVKEVKKAEEAKDDKKGGDK